jgi:hypothetical protein
MAEEKKDRMGVYDVLLIINLVQSIAMQIYAEYKQANPAPMTKEEWDEISPSIVSERKKAVQDALSI